MNNYERAVNVFHAIEGGKQTLARLAAYLLELPAYTTTRESEKNR